MKAICYDLYCGLGGWTEAFIEEGYRCIGFDIEAHEYWAPDKPESEAMKNTGGSWFTPPSGRKCVGKNCPDGRKTQRNADGSFVRDSEQWPMKLLKYPGELRIRDVRSIHGSELRDAAVIVGSSPCQEFSYRAMPWKRAKALPPPYLGMELFNAQFRIQREACEAAGRHIPMVVENVRGAQKWVGRAPWNYGSFYLWGDVPALMPHTFKGIKVGGTNISAVGFNVAAVRKVLHGDPNMTCAEGRKVSMNFHEHEKTGKPGRSFQSAAVEEMGIKGIPHRTKGHWTNPAEHEGAKSSRSSSRKLASAMIAKIPRPLALHIARAYKPVELEATA